MSIYKNKPIKQNKSNDNVHLNISNNNFINSNTIVQYNLYY